MVLMYVLKLNNQNHIIIYLTVQIILMVYYQHTYNSINNLYE